MLDKKRIAISKCIERISFLTGEDFHGYRSEVWSAISAAIDECSAQKEYPGLPSGCHVQETPVGTCPECEGCLMPAIRSGGDLLLGVACVGCGKTWT